MDLKFQISKPANIFHLVDNLSRWSIHTRDYVRRLFVEDKPLTEEDEDMLTRYRWIRFNHPWGHLDSDFIPARSMPQAFARAKQRLSGCDFSTLYEVVQHFLPTAGAMYNEARPRLVEQKKSLEETVAQLNFPALFKEVADFYEASSYAEHATVHLLLGTEGVSGGGANIEPKEHVTLELDLASDDVLGYLAVVAHEVLHLIEYNADKQKFQEAAKLAAQHGLEDLEVDILREAIADTLLPDGILAVKYGLAPKAGILGYEEKPIIVTSQADYFESFRQKLSAHLYPLTEHALREGRSVFDDGYLQKAITVLKNLKQNC